MTNKISPCQQESEFLKKVCEQNYRLLFASSLVFQVSGRKGAWMPTLTDTQQTVSRSEVKVNNNKYDRWREKKASNRTREIKSDTCRAEVMWHDTAQSETIRNAGRGRGRWERVGEWKWRVGYPSSHDIMQMALSGADMMWMCGLQPPPPAQIPNKSLNSLTNVQQQAPPCQRAPAPKQSPDCNLTRPPHHHLTHLECETLTELHSSWKPHKLESLSLHVHHPLRRDRTSWSEHDANRTRVCRFACSTRFCKLRIV